MICWNWLAFDLLDCNAGPGCLLDRVGWGFVELDPLVSSKEKPVLKSLWIVWGDGLAMGICQNVWGNRDTVWEDGLCVGGRRVAWGAAKTYGKCHGI